MITYLCYVEKMEEIAMIHYIESNQIIDEVIKSDKLVIMAFFATWCVPCQMLTEVLREIDKNYSEKVEIFKVDVDENQEVAIRYGVTAMPTLVFFKEGEEVEREVGFLEKEELEELIEDLLK